MFKYVTSLVFTPDLQYVLLVEKKRGPDFILGKWTAIGGEVEPGENLLDAATRELKEEADAEIPLYLREVALLKRGSECMLFTGLLGDDEHYAPLTDEAVELFPVDGIMAGDYHDSVADDTQVLVAMALHKIQGGKLFFSAREVP